MVAAHITAAAAAPYASRRPPVRVASHDRQAVVEGGCRNDELGLRKGVPGLAPLLDEQAPLEHDILGNLEYALAEHRPHLVRQPTIELGAADRIDDHFDAVTDLGECHRADE